MSFTVKPNDLLTRFKPKQQLVVERRGALEIDVVAEDKRNNQAREAKASLATATILARNNSNNEEVARAGEVAEVLECFARQLNSAQ
jgi:hypothetical protein